MLIFNAVLILLASFVMQVSHSIHSTDDKSMVTEKIEPLPRSPAKKPSTEKLVKQKAKSGRAKGRVSTPERKPIWKDPGPVHKEELKKKKGCRRKSDLHIAKNV